MTITIDSKAFKQIMDKLNFIEKSLIAMAPKASLSKWMSETEVTLLTGLGKRSLHDKRKSGVFNWTTATGRKVKYLRSDIDKYLDKNSTLHVHR